MDRLFDTAIIGGGPGGYTAALYAARAGLKTLVIEKLSVGGQITETLKIDNYPGIPEGIDGYSLGENMKAGAEKYGAETQLSEVTALDLSAEPKRILTDGGEVLAKTVILATGAVHRHLGIAREEELVGRGVGYCATCDGMFYRGRTVAVIGGGNSAVADALYLSGICERVYLVHRRDRLRAERIYEEALLKANNVELVWNSELTALLGEEKVDGVRLKNRLDGTERELSVAGVFISIGRAPETALVKEQLPLDEHGYIVADETTEPNIPGVYAVGDVRPKPLRQIITAAADGAVAATRAAEYLWQKER